MCVVLLNSLERLNNILNAEKGRVDVPDTSILFRSTNPHSGDASIFTYDVACVRPTYTAARKFINDDDEEPLVDAFHLYLVDNTMKLVIGCSGGFLLASFVSVQYGSDHSKDSFDFAKVAEHLDEFKRWHTTYQTTYWFSGGELVNWISESRCLQALTLRGSAVTLVLNLSTHTDTKMDMHIRFELVSP